jgi:hypothetical protein
MIKALALTALLAGAATAASDSFRRGQVELQAGGGFGSLNHRGYGIAMLGGSYYLADGLSVGLTGESWFGSNPTMGNVSPQARFIFLDNGLKLKPFVGAFYRRTFYSSRYRPEGSVGARGGVVLPIGERAFLTGGLAIEHYASCDKAIYDSCDLVYPEFSFAVGF